MRKPRGERAQRKAVVEEAISWLGTTHHHQAKVKGGGVDCLQLFGMVFSNVGLIAPLPYIEYAPDGHLHHGEEVVLEWLRKYAFPIKIDKLLPADLLVYKYGRRFSHGAIFIEPPRRIIHAVLGRQVEWGDMDKVRSGEHLPSDRMAWRFNGWAG